MSDMGWNPVDGWASGPGSSPRRPSYRPEPGFLRAPSVSQFVPRVPMAPPRCPRPDFMPPGFGPPPRIRSPPSRGFCDIVDENVYSRAPAKFQHGPPPHRPKYLPGDFIDMFGGMSLSGSTKGSNDTHNTSCDGMRLSETPVAFPISPSGKKIHCIIDTGASITSVKRSALRRYFPGIAVTRGVEITMTGIGGAGDKTDERVVLPLTFISEGGELVRAHGEAWVVKGEHLDTDILLGLPFMRDNGMHLQWGGGAGRRSRGDHISCRGLRIPITIDAHD